MRRIQVCLFLFCLGLFGCATTAKYEAKLNTWIGASEDALVASWGVPNKTYTLSNGKKAIEYVRRETGQTGGYVYTMPVRTYESGNIGGQLYSGTSVTNVPVVEPVQEYRLVCMTSFVLDKNGKAESWHHEGNNCVSK